MKKYLLYGLIIFIVALFFSSILVVFKPRIKLKGNTIKINVNEEYKEPGYEAYNLVTKLDNKVIIKNNLNNKKIGVYKEKYIVKYLFFKVTKERKIEVVDNIKPEIKILFEDKEICRYKYKEYKYEATDNYDGNITDKVEVTLDKNILTYKVKDSSDNETIVKKEIKIKDNKPSIKLSGSSNMYIIINNEFKEPGYKATDSCDGDLTDKVVVEGKVDTKKLGTYEIKYKVKNKDEKEAKVVRKVHIIKKPSIKLGTVYLTFDDGPSHLTPDFLKVLDKYGVKATFFVTNQFPNYQYLLKEEASKGHTVALHTYTHAADWRMYNSLEAYLDDFNKMNDIIEKQTGSKTKLFRFPGGSSNTVSVRKKKGVVSEIASYMTKEGYIYFDWNVSSGDAGGTTNQDVIYSNVVNGVHRTGTAVVLCHDIKPATLKALPRIIETLSKEGYTFAPLTESSPTMHQKIAN